MMLRPNPIQRVGFTLIEVLIVISIVSILMALLFPAVQRARESMRRTQCISNLKNVSLAIANYESAFRVYPAIRRSVSSIVDDNGEVGLAWTTSILPFIEAAASADELQDRITRGTLNDPWNDDKFYRRIYPAGVLACPSDLQTPPTTPKVTGQLSYRASLGDLIEDNHLRPKNVRGLFGDNSFLRPASVLDGLSNTILLTEMASAGPGGAKDPVGSILIQYDGSAYSDLYPGGCVARWESAFIDVQRSDERTGTRWADGRPYYAGVVVALPPNSKKCVSGLHDHLWGVFTAGSRHSGGCNISMGDGSVRFITESIDTGDLSVPGKKTISGESPYGVWGAMGTRAGRETIRE